MAELEHVELVREGRGAVAARREDVGGAALVLDLAGADLAGVDLSGMDLRDARLAATELRGTDLSGADLRGADLSKARLREADLRGARLDGVRLDGAVLEEAQLDRSSLRGASFTGAELGKTRFDHADLTDADLEDARSLFGWQLRGACVTGAKLPAGIRDFEPLAHVEELTRASRRLFLTELLACSYVGLTIGTTTDLELLLNSATSTLPILDTPVPTLSFYYVAPLVLCAVYLYLCLYLQRLWESLSDLPAEFPDGIALDKKAHPWLLSGLVRCHFPNLRRWKLPFTDVQGRVSTALAYWVVPATLLCMWLRCLPRHDLLLSGVQVVACALALAGSAVFRRLCRATLRGEDLWRPRNRREPLSAARRPRIAWGTLRRADRRARRMLAASLLVLGTISALVSYRAELFFAWQPSRQSLRVLSFAPADLFTLNLEGAEISKSGALRMLGGELSGPTGAAVTGLAPFADLSHRSLRAARASGVALRSVSLRGADLAHAVLRDADLQQSDLTGANLQRADLRNAQLSQADLRDANLVGADLRGASFERVKLRGADLSEARVDRGSATFQQLRASGLDLYQASRLAK